MALTDLIPWARNRDLGPARVEDTDPFLALHRNMNRMLDDFSASFGVPFARTNWSSTWPHVEVKESGENLQIVADLPGLEEKDVEISLADGVLSLKGEKKVESEKPLYSERWHGRFQRNLQIGPDIDPEKISASFKNGVLTITCGKRLEAQTQVKRIPINA